MSAALQHLDLDIYEDMWEPPKSLIDKRKLNGTPQHGIGRSCKAGKEEIVGLLTALRLFSSESDALRHGRWLHRLQQVGRGLAKSPLCNFNIEGKDDQTAVPQLIITPTRKGASVAKIIATLIKASPSIHVDPVRRDHGMLVVNPLCFDDADAPMIAKRIAAALA